MLELHLSPDDNLSLILNDLKTPATIYLKGGIYRQKTEIRADNLTIIGEDRETTVITYDDYARKIHADGQEYNTFRTYTLCIAGEGIRLENLTVENSNTHPEEVGQCVALSVHAKNFLARNVKLKSTQDTLFCSPFPDDLVTRYRGFIPANQLYMEGWGVQLFENCEISGTVDFIFGCAEAYFHKCKLISLKDARGHGYVAAPAHSLMQPKGFTFFDCDFISGGAEEGSVYLARPWRDYGKCDFVDCRIGKHINAALFDKWNDTERDKTARFAYGKCDFEGKIAPVGWCKALPDESTNEIISGAKAKFKDI